MQIKLITGMFQMDTGDIFVSDDSLVLSTPDGERRILLDNIETISITRHAERNVRLEINLEHEVIEGVFIRKSDADDFANSLKERKGSVLQINFQGL